MLRALDWLRAAISALLETCMRRLRLVGWAAAPSVFAACLCEAPKGPNRPELTITGCSKRWNCGLRFKVEFPALALAVLKHWHAYISEEQPTFGEHPPARGKTCDRLQNFGQATHNTQRRRGAPHNTSSIA